MRFVCDNPKLDVLDRAAVALSVDLPGAQQFIELDDERLIAIARTLGMEEMSQVNSNKIAPVLSVSPQSEVSTDMPACEICGKPVSSKRQRVCSDECRAEKQRRYAREYQRRKAQEAGSEPESPLAEWGSDPGDEPVRAGGLG